MEFARGVLFGNQFIFPQRIEMGKQAGVSSSAMAVEGKAVNPKKKLAFGSKAPEPKVLLKARITKNKFGNP